MNRGTAEPVDKNPLRIVQPTLGFLSAVGGILYGNYERGHPQVLKRVSSYGVHTVGVLPIHFGVVLGCKGGGGKKNTFLGPEKFFQTKAFQTEL